MDAGLSLEAALQKFNKWLLNIIEKWRLTLPKVDAENRSGNVCIATWSDWDLGDCLTKECSRKKIKKPIYFDQWIDVRAIYKVEINTH